MDLAKYKWFLPFEGMQIPVLDLRYEVEAYRKMGRLEKAELLQRYLDG